MQKNICKHQKKLQNHTKMAMQKKENRSKIAKISPFGVSSGSIFAKFIVTTLASRTGQGGGRYRTSVSSMPLCSPNLRGMNEWVGMGEGNEKGMGVIMDSSTHEKQTSIANTLAHICDLHAEE